MSRRNGPTSVRFVVNLRTDTITDAFVAGCRPHGWLVAPANTTAGTRRFALGIAGRRRLFVADNGNYAALGDVTASYAATAAGVRAEVDRIEERLGRTARRRDLSSDTRSSVDELAEKVAAAAAAATVDPEVAMEAQERLGASVLIGCENLVPAALLAANLEPHLLAGSRALCRTANRAVARHAARVIASRPELARRYYPVVGALDYWSAYDAGALLADAGVTCAAMGFGAYMADNHSTDFVEVGRRRIALSGRLPQRYVRTAAVARGFFDGYRVVAGRPPDGVHFLGLGAPIMVAVVSVAAAGVGLVSFDAMSPIKDAVEGTLYTTKPAYLKLRTRAIAERLAGPRRGEWLCPCPFCAGFVAAHPFNYDAARSAWRGSVSPSVLRPRGALYSALPLLSEPRGGSLRRAVNDARAGHNHWVLTRTCEELHRAMREDRLDRHVGRIVTAYGAATNSPRYADAVRLGLEIAGG